MSYKSPCKDCANRSIGCHPNCKTYLDSVEKHREDVQRRRKVSDVYNQLYAFKKEGVQKAVRARGF